MKYLIFITVIFFSACISQRTPTRNEFSTTEFNGMTYYNFPVDQKIGYYNDLPYWKWNIVRDEFGLTNRQEANGNWIQFYNNDSSTVAKTFSLEDGKYDGTITLYFSNGQLESIGNYQNDEISGLRINYFKTGDVRDSTIYRLDTANNGHIFSNKIFFKSFYKDGRIHKIQSFDSLGVKNGFWKEYYENGQLRIEQEYTNQFLDINQPAYTNGLGDRINSYNYYYPNGQLRFSLNYKKNRIQNGLFEEFYESGKLKLRGNLVEGLREGRWTEWYENESTLSTGEFQNGDYIMCGSTSFTAYYEYKIGEWIYFHPNGEISATGAYVTTQRNVLTGCKGGADLNCGKISETWKFFEQDGTLMNIDEGLANQVIIDKEILDKRVYDISE